MGKRKPKTPSNRPRQASLTYLFGDIEMSQIIEKTSKHVVEIDENDKELVISYTYFPLPGYDNNVKKGIYFDKEAKTVKVLERWDNWNGTGVKKLAHVELEDNEFKTLLEAARKVKKVGDFKDLLEAIEQVEDQVEKRIQELADDVIYRLEQLSISTEIREILKNKEKLLDILYQYTSE